MLVASGCVMSGYDPAPLGHGVTPPDEAGHGGSAGAGGDGEAGGGATGTGGAGSGGAGNGSAGSEAPRVRDVCGSAAEGAPCNDGRKCTLNDACLDGYCVGTAKLCLDTTLNACGPIRCDETNGECANIPVTDGTQCGLTGTAACVAGLCKSPDVCTEPLCTNLCDEDACLYECSGAEVCNSQCLSSFSCVTRCTGAGRCALGCDEDSHCRADCSNSQACELRCKAGATCVVDCRGATECGVRCDAGATCSLLCTAGADCGFDACEGGEMSCGADRIGCGGCL